MSDNYSVEIQEKRDEDHTRTFRMSMSFERVENMTYLGRELYRHIQMQEELEKCEEAIENHHHKYSNHTVRCCSSSSSSVGP